MSSSGSSRGWLAPSARGCGSSNTTCPRALSVNRSSASGGRKRYDTDEITRTPALHLVARHEGGQQLPPGAAFAFGGGQARGNDEDAGVGEHVGRVALVVDRHRHAPGEARTHAGHAPALHP